MKVITVESCNKCPYSCSDYYRGQFMIAHCEHPAMKWSNNGWEYHSKAIEEENDYLSFPNWCPL